MDNTRDEARITVSQEASWVKALEKVEAGLEEKAKAEDEAKKEKLLDIAAEETSWVAAFAKMKARLDMKDKAAEEAEAESRRIRMEAAMASAMVGGNYTGSASGANTINFAKNKPRSRYEARVRAEAAKNEIITIEHIQGAMDIKKMGAELKREADLTGLIMARLNHQIEMDWAAIRKARAETVRRVQADIVKHEQAALEDNQKTLEQNAKSRRFREAMGVRKTIGKDK